MKIKRFYGLMIASMVLKSLAVISIIGGLGGVGAIVVNAMSFEGRYATPYAVETLARVVGLLVVCGLFAFFCYVIAQLIDVQIQENEYLRLINEKMDKIISSQAKETK